jgi:MFS family permease
VTTSEPPTALAERDAPLQAGAREPAARPSGGAGFTLRTFDSLSDRDFRWFYLALLGQMAAMNMQMLARGYLAFELTDSFAALGAIGLANAIPMLALSLFGGLLADGAPKKLVLQIGQTASALIALGVGLLLVADMLSYPCLLAAGAAQGVVMALMMPSRQSILPEVVGMRRLMNAVSLQAAGMNLMRLLAPAAGGFLIAIVGAEAVYFIMTAMYMVAVFALAPVRLRHEAPDRAAAARHGGGAALAEGFRYIAGNRTILVLLVLNFVIAMLAMPYLLLLPGFVEEIFGGGAEDLGLLIAVGGVGSLGGALVLASLPPRRRGLLLVLSGLLMGVALVGFSASPSIWVGGAFMLVVGVGSAGRQALGNILLQTYTENAYRGRVMAIYMTQISVMSVGAFVIGVIAEVSGARWALGGMATLLVIVSIGFFVLVPRLRRLD